MSISKALNKLGFWNEVDLDTEITDFKLEDNGDGKGVVIVWLSDKTQPSDADIKTADDALQAEYVSLTYSRARQAEYAKLNQFEMQFDDQRDSTTTWVDAVNAIKAQFPKPS